MAGPSGFGDGNRPDLSSTALCVSLILNQDQRVRANDPTRYAVSADRVCFRNRAGPIFPYNDEVVRSGPTRRDRCEK